MSPKHRIAALFGLFALVTSCAKELTEIVLVVDSDLSVPTELDRVAVTLDGPTSHSESSAALSGAGSVSLPLTLGMVPSAGASSVTVTAVGTLAGREVVRRFVRASFVQGQRRMLYVTLLRSCVGVTCPAGQTCSAEGCTDGVAASLPPWTGTPPARLDASAPTDATVTDASDGSEDVFAPADVTVEAAVDAPVTPTDVAPDAAADVPEEPRPDVTDSGVDAAPDVAPDVLPDVTPDVPPRDVSPADVVDASMCPGARADCDRNAGNGCEVDTANDPLNCGACGRACAGRANSMAVCIAGVCMNVCATGFGDCNAMSSDGCEASLRTTANCGTCGSNCAPRPNTAATCPTGTCVYACATGFGDCDGDVANGCETNLQSSVTGCGMCGRSCARVNATARCGSGVCSFVCTDGFADCDGVTANGCEANLRSAATCGSCTIACPAPRMNMTANCPASVCLYACSTGFGDCDGDPTNGCEANLVTTVSQCGACGTVCGTNPSATPACVSGRCANACMGLRGDCDGNVLNGCELDVSSDASHCGSCTRECGGDHAVFACRMGACRVESCDMGFADCDGSATTGCETDIRTAANCGACRNACTSAQRCAMGRCVAL